MKATSIKGSDVKGTSFDYALTPITIFVGGNASGKSAVASAIRLAMMGYDPELGKTAAASFQLASGSRLWASIDFDNGKRNSVLLYAAGESVKLEFEQNVVTPGILMGADDYFKKTGPERRQYLFALAGKGMQFDAGKLTAAMKSIRLDPHPAHAEAIIQNAIEQLELMDADRIGQEQRLDEFFSSLIAAFKENEAEAKVLVKQMRGSIQASVSIAAQEGMPVAAVDVEKQLSAARENLTDLKSRHGLARKEVEDNNSQRTLRASALQQLQSTALIDDESKQLLAQVESAKANVSALVDPVWGEREAYRKKATEAEDAFDAIDWEPQEMTRLCNLRLEIEQEEVRVNTLLMSARLNLDAITGRMSGCCPKCGAIPEHWSRATLDLSKAEKAKFSDEIIQYEEELKIVVTRKADVASKIQAMEVNRTKADAALSVLNVARLAMADAERKFVSDHSLESSKATKAHHEAMRYLERHQSEVAMAKEKHAAAKQRLEDLKPAKPDVDLWTELFSWMDEENPPGDDGLEKYLEMWTSRIVAAEQKIAALDTQQRAALRIKAKLAEEEKVKVALEQQETAVLVYGKVLDLLIADQEAVITGGIKSFMERASTLTASVMGFPLEFREGDIGYYKNGTWVTHKVLSGTEKHLAYTGLCLAFAENAPCKLVIIDELGRLTPENKRALVARFQELITAGVVDNFIGIDTIANDYRCGISPLLSVYSL